MKAFVKFFALKLEVKESHKNDSLFLAKTIKKIYNINITNEVIENE